MLKKRKPLSPSLFIAFAIGCTVGFAFYPTVTPSWEASALQNASIRACFSPGGQCTDKIVSAIDTAKSSIMVMAYSFTSPQIAQALADAFQRGVDVQILIDRSQLKEKHSQLEFLKDKDIPVFIDAPQGLAHNKVMIIDQRYVLSGSFNFTRAADSRNAENILFIDNPELAQIYRHYWEKRKNLAR